MNITQKTDKALYLSSYPLISDMQCFCFYFIQLQECKWYEIKKKKEIKDCMWWYYPKMKIQLEQFKTKK